MTAPRLREFASPVGLAEELAEVLANVLRAALADRPVASLVVPGGRTPAALFRALRSKELDWSRVTITLTDERCVPVGDAASNAAMVRAELLQEKAATARLIPLWTDTSRVASGADAAWLTLRGIPRPFDVVLLGMGEDGHIASLFPDAPGIADALRPQAATGCVFMRARAAPVERISLNLAALLQARRLFLLISGSRKKQIIERAAVEAANKFDGGLPIAALCRETSQPLEVYWSP
jgi:6-phosphogluconolactonase